MAKPTTPVRPIEVPEGLIPPQKIIESLPTHKKSKSPVETPRPLIPAHEGPFQAPPLRWEEVFPSMQQIEEFFEKTLIVMVSVGVAFGLWVMGLQLFSLEWSRMPSTSQVPAASVTPKTALPIPPAMTPTVPQETTLVTPPGLHPHPTLPTPMTRVVPRPPTSSLKPTLPTPENVSARFYSPTMIELSWDSLGQNYRYRLYSAQTSSMKGARAETKVPIVNPYIAWTPQSDAAAMWVAVRGIDSKGREGPFSEPIQVRVR